MTIQMILYVMQCVLCVHCIRYSLLHVKVVIYKKNSSIGNGLHWEEFSKTHVPRIVFQIYYLDEEGSYEKMLFRDIDLFLRRVSFHFQFFEICAVEFLFRGWNSAV